MLVKMVRFTVKKISNFKIAKFSHRSNGKLRIIPRWTVPILRTFEKKKIFLDISFFQEGRDIATLMENGVPKNLTFLNRCPRAKEA